MSNTSKGKALKGSKFWMQVIVNSKLQNKLSSDIGGDIEWLSPIKGENADYLEYELRQEYICGALNITDIEKKEMFSFWPNRQPQWDGIALTKSKNILYLVEAKAHLSELKSKISARSETSRALIVNSMREVFDKRYSKGDFSLWTDKYYQLANRLTFLHKLNEVLSSKNIEVKLVLLNFVGDYTYKPTSEAEFENHYKKVFAYMTGYESVSPNIIVINFPVGCIGVNKETMSRDFICYRK